MSKKLNLLFLYILMFCVQISFAQNTDILRMEDGRIILRISTKISQKALDSVLKEMNMMRMSMDSLKRETLNKAYIAEGWQVLKAGKDYVELFKMVESVNGKYEFINHLNVIVDKLQGNGDINTFYPTAVYGFNVFKNRTSVFPLNNKGLTRFVFYKRLNARKVYLSGSFNAWAIEEIEMQKTDTAWYCDIQLKAGKHLYKFIVDGDWTEDPENKQKESDTYSGYNSVYFSCNHLFKLEGFTNAKRVIVCGSFNDWNEGEISLKKINGTWMMPVYLRDGSYSYKFIVDREWMTDPANADVRNDGSGNMNSFLSIGKPAQFELSGFERAKEVSCAGSFNDWRTGEVPLKRETDKWLGYYVLASGNYEYKYFVDGKWYADPANPVYVGEYENRNSLKVINPNYTFTLKGFLGAREVRVSGSFLSWPNPGITMNKTDTGWYVQMYLPPGKHLYKFIVDGDWMTDPANPLFEQNEHNTGNSFIWIEEKRK